MKLFLAGIVVASIGFSGVANILNLTLRMMQSQVQHLNAQVEQIEMN